MSGDLEPSGDFAVALTVEEHASLRRLAGCFNEPLSVPAQGDLAALERLASRIVPFEEWDLRERVLMTGRERAQLMEVAVVLRRGDVEAADSGSEILEEVAHRHRVACWAARPGQEPIGERAWVSRYLGPEARRALAASCTILLDDLIDSLAQQRSAVPLAETMFGARLPDRPYPANFLRRLLVCLAQVAGKLGGQTQPMPSCVAEEVCAYLILEEARELASDNDSPWHSESANRELEVFDVLEDTDFLLLWDPTTPAPPVEGWTIAPDASIEEWFDPFNASRGEVHPYVSGSERPARPTA